VSVFFSATAGTVASRITALFAEIACAGASAEYRQSLIGFHLATIVDLVVVIDALQAFWRQRSTQIP
jgi:hypothetical protein